MVKIYIGYDKVESVAYHVLSHSIIARSSIPISITPLCTSHFSSFFKRPREELQSNDFSFTRFLVPFLQNYDGWAVYMDCDILCLDDISKLLDCIDNSYVVMCVKNVQNVEDTRKYYNHAQVPYKRKNWSSVMLFNCGLCKKLTTAYVQKAGGLELHQFQWTHDDYIGSLDPRWNHLVGYSETKNPSLVHFTDGGPWLKGYRKQPYAMEWWKEFYDMIDYRECLTPGWIPS